MASRVGQRLGEYRLTRFLGDGHFGEVYLGEHIHEGMQAAIKVLKTPLTVEQDLEKFISEARLFRLKHPHIIQLLDFGIEEDRTPFLVMEYAANGTLRQRHPRGSQVPLPAVVSYVKQVASALQYAHDRKLIHRDVKPENLLIGSEDRILVGDFGIATVAHSTSSLQIQDQVGTIPYMAPEQIQGKPRPASDQYALGVIVYEWLCGECPFDGSRLEIAMQHALAPPTPLYEKISGLPFEVSHVVLTALAKDHHHRFADIEAFASALEQAGKISPEEPFRLVLPPSYDTAQFVTSANPGSMLTEQNPSPEDIPSNPSPEDSPLPQSPIRLQRRVSRRGIIIRLGGLVAVGAAGCSIVWLVRSQGMRMSSLSSRPSATPTATSAPIPAGTLLSTYYGHNDVVWELVWSPDGKRIASASFDKTVQVWNVADKSHVYIYRGHTAILKSVAWSPIDDRIASGSQDLTAQVWGAANGENPILYNDGNYVNGIAWSPNGKYVACGSGDKTVRVWNAADGRNIYIYHGHSVYLTKVMWSPNGEHIASGSGDTTVQVWNATDGGNVYVYRGHSSSPPYQVTAVRSSPDGKRIASSAEKTVQVWNATDGSRVYTYQGHTGLVNAVTWSPDGKRIASATADGTVQIWGATDGGNVYVYRGHGSAPVNTVAWSPSGKLIASGGNDITVQVWQAP